MIKLTELLHSVNDEKKEGFIPLDDWRWPDVDHLVNMGFDFTDDFHLSTTKDPKISIHKRKEKDDQNKVIECYYVEEPDREKKRFSSFNDIIDYFDTYSQPDLDKNME